MTPTERMRETRTVPLSQGKVALVDAVDYQWITQWNWFVHRTKRSRTLYAFRVQRQNGKRHTVWMHRALLNAPSGSEIDHIDGDGLNNCRANLRFATSAQNRVNCPLRCTNKSGYKGVCWHKASRKWMARIKFNKQQINLGTFADIKDAAAAYAEAAKKYHGEFTCQR